MYLIAIAWAYVALMMAAAEATSPQGTLFGAFITLMLYGILPLGLLLYILGTPGRRRRRRAAEAGLVDTTGVGREGHPPGANQGAARRPH